MLCRVFFVVCAKIRIGFVQPRLLFFSGLKISSHTDTHPHVLVDDVLSLLEGAGDREAVLVHPVQVTQHLPQFFVGINVREVHLSQAAGLEVGKTLLSTRVKAHYVRVGVLGVPSPAHPARCSQIDQSVRLSVTLVSFPELLRELTDVVTHNRVVGHGPPVRDVAEVPTLGPQELNVVMITQSDLSGAADVTSHYDLTDDVHDIEAIHAGQAAASLGVQDLVDLDHAPDQVLATAGGTTEPFDLCTLRADEVSGKRKSFASLKACPEHTVEKLNPTLTGVGNDEVCIIDILSLYRNLGFHLRKLIHVLTLDVESHPTTKHQHLERPSERTDGLVDDNERTVLQGRESQLVYGLGSELPQESASYGALQVQHDVPKLLLINLVEVASELFVARFDYALNSVGPLLSLSVFGRSRVRSLERGVSYLTPWDKFFCLHFLKGKACKIVRILLSTAILGRYLKS